MRNLTRFLPILLLPLVFSASAAARQPGQPRPEEKKQQTAKEDPYLKRFQELDRDDDGYVSPGEWPLDADSFKVVDRNQDGRLSQGELLTPNRFRRDWDPQVPPPAPPQAPRVERPAPPRQNPGNAWSPHVRIQDQRLLRNLDRNGDNRLRRREWNGSDVQFRRLDTNQDGVLSPRELSRN